MSKQVKMAVKGAAFAPVDDFVWFQGKLKVLPEENYRALKKSILSLGFSYALNIWINPEGKLMLIDGHQRVLTLKRMRDEGYEIPFIAYDSVEAESYQQAKQKVLAGVAQYGKVEVQGVADFLADIEFDPMEFNTTFIIPEVDFSMLPSTKEIVVSEHTREIGGDKEDEVIKGNLSAKFLVPPFSVLNAREGWWQDRKRAWLSSGLDSGLGRSSKLLSESVERESFGGDYDLEKGESAWGGSGTSIFDPVLAEVAYTWFMPKDGVIIDPFAGGSVRGIVASKLGKQYYGQDLSPDQVQANKLQANTICANDKNKPVWNYGDSKNIDSTYKNVAADLVFSCPPYFDLEQYSSNPADLSNMTYPEFLKAYEEIIKKSCALLKNDRFACFVVGDVRDKTGAYLNFVGDTVKAFQKAGLKYYNEIILVTAVGSLPIRAGRYFNTTRKVGKTHQNILVFCKGDPKKATLACGEVDVLEMPEEGKATKYGELLTDDVV